MADSQFIENLVPGSDTCILIGRAPADLSSQFQPVGPWRILLWIAELNATPLAPLTSAVTILGLDQTTAAEIETAIEDFFTKSPRHLPSILVSRSISPKNEALYLKAVESAAAASESHNRARITRQRDSFAWQQHIFRNLPDYAAHRLPAAWAGALAGLPAFIVGAGPSLDSSIHVLAQGAPGAIIFAADSSLRALAKAGVTPDFAVSVDVTKEPARCLPDSAPPPERVVLSANSPPAWRDAIPDSGRFYVSSNQLTLDWLAAQGIPRTGPEVRENCGATAIEVARYLGCAPIHLFGMDLALNEDADTSAQPQRHHGQVSPVDYSKSGFNPQGQFPRVPGNFAETVPTHVLGDWRTLDRRIAALPPGLIWVITDRGAKLANTTLVRPENLQAPTAFDKATRLASLAKADSAAAATLQGIAGKLTPFAADLLAWIPSIRASLATAGPEALAASLRSLFATPQHGQILGAYSLKLMPHLLPPIDPTTDWPTLITELETLAREISQSASALSSPP